MGTTLWARATPTASQRAPTVLNPHDWVDAAPFRALAERLVIDSGLEWQTVAIGARIPLRTMRSLVGTGAKRRVRRIRRTDARRLLAVNAAALRTFATTLGDANGARTALLELPHLPSPLVIARIANTDLDTVTGLLNGWVERCPRGVIWRLQAFVQEQHAALAWDYFSGRVHGNLPTNRHQGASNNERIATVDQRIVDTDERLVMAA